jgi:hypothetical protein
MIYYKPLSDKLDEKKRPYASFPNDYHCLGHNENRPVGAGHWLLLKKFTCTEMEVTETLTAVNPDFGEKNFVCKFFLFSAVPLQKKVITRFRNQCCGSGFVIQDPVPV